MEALHSYNHVQEKEILYCRYVPARESVEPGTYAYILRYSVCSVYVRVVKVHEVVSTLTNKDAMLNGK